MDRKASCACGQLSISLKGDPDMVLACSCLECQKRTGSVVNVSSYFNDDQIIDKSGASKVYKRSSDVDRWIEFYFCPNCGSTVFWVLEALEKKTGVAVGCFSDPGFPSPALSLWNESKHEWIHFPEQLHCDIKQESLG